MNEVWKPIKNFDGNYEISNFGRVRKIYKCGKTKYLIIKPSQKCNKVEIRLRNNKKRKGYSLHRLVAETFIRPLKKGECVYHIDGVIANNAVWNLEITGRRKIGYKTGAKSSSKAVIKLDITGVVVDAYKSAREAGRQNFMSYQTVIDRCNGVAGKKGIQAPDGFVYCWDNEKSYFKTLEKIKSEAIKKNIIFLGYKDMYYEKIN